MDFMIRGNEDPPYTVTTDVTKENKKFIAYEGTIQLKALNQDFNSFEEAVDFCHNYIDSIHSQYIEPIDDNIRIRTVIQHEEFYAVINFQLMKKKI